ncbi:MAG: class I SAM-dependent methyltransferase [Taibaiella sp.]|nr:class I SAM-dependent methyltransferase [Taibaiella sp.]
MNNSTRKFYDILAPFYTIIGFFLKNGIRKLEVLLSKENHQRILDIGLGCSAGYLKKNFGKVTGVDISANMIRRKSSLYQCIYHQDVVEMEGAEIYDAAVACYVVSVMPIEAFMETMYRILKPQGKLYIVNHFTPRNFLGKIEKLLSGPASWFHFRLYFNPSMIPMDGFRIVHQEKNRLVG